MRPRGSRRAHPLPRPTATRWARPPGRADTAVRRGTVRRRAGQSSETSTLLRTRKGGGANARQPLASPHRDTCARKPAEQASPAPVASTNASTGAAGTSHRSPPRPARIPRPPALTTTKVEGCRAVSWSIASSAVATAVGSPTEAMPHASASFGRKTSSSGRSRRRWPPSPLHLPEQSCCGSMESSVPRALSARSRSSSASSCKPTQLK
mmetsp:Transcript_38030/g.119669  ORF Transcript_38030/g.119669 Transcript_38030/m.119669 type:complete len:209 (+) Transcript_38030:159-785(+)